MGSTKGHRGTADALRSTNRKQNRTSAVTWGRAEPERSATKSGSSAGFGPVEGGSGDATPGVSPANWGRAPGSPASSKAPSPNRGTWPPGRWIAIAETRQIPSVSHPSDATLVFKTARLIDTRQQARKPPHARLTKSRRPPRRGHGLDTYPFSRCRYKRCLSGSGDAARQGGVLGRQRLAYPTSVRHTTTDRPHSDREALLLIGTGLGSPAVSAEPGGSR